MLRKKDYLPETWSEKFEDYQVGMEYLYSFTRKEQLMEAKQAVDAANNSSRFLLHIHATSKMFSICCLPRP